ncbi:MAG: CinA family protein [Actinobacteria bacterium]|nr:MAG: CinA family protein [Actinomycetota bacterium]
MKTLASSVGDLLRERKMTLAVAESVTGGYLSNLITNVSGSSDYFKGGFIVYSNELKKSTLGVDSQVLQKHGAVSPEVAVEMALGAINKSGSDTALSITGIAGPLGETEDKPVGLNYIGYADKRSTETHKFIFSKSRQDIKQQAAQKALEILYKHLMEDYF